MATAHGLRGATDSDISKALRKDGLKKFGVPKTGRVFLLQLTSLAACMVLITLNVAEFRPYLSSSLSAAFDLSRKNQDTATSATSGQLFTMKKIRSADPSRLLFRNQQLMERTPPASLWPSDSFWNKKCKHWATITSIFDVTEATARVSRLPEWCLVVTGDRKGPEQYEISGGQVVFLSQSRQEELAELVPFVKLIPWNHFGRKNIAYLYAIVNGAEYIWDFDDDNDLIPGASFNELAASSNQRQVVQVDNENNTACQVFNPSKYFQPSARGLWPRGYPLEKIHDARCQLVNQYCRRTATIGIWQSLANGDPDVDGIFRLTRGDELPVQFSGPLLQDGRELATPPETMSPMNAQAALFHRSAFWSLFLPTTVHGRVSDIWRSYIAQTILKLTGLEVAFVGPLVVQVRNAHNYLADMNSEQPLYERAGALVEFLLAWKDSASDDTLEGSLERLYFDLYEHGILEWDDVELVQEWLMLLNALNYEFPTVQGTNSTVQSCLEYQPLVFAEPDSSKAAAEALPQVQQKKYSNVVLVGQFNWNLEAEYVLHWVKRWSELFEHVHVRGPFNETNLKILQANNVKVFESAEDAGYFSPMKNMAETLRAVADDAAIDGVLITHDDLIFNLTHLESLGFPSKTDVLSQAPPEVTDKPYLYFNNNFTFRIDKATELRTVDPSDVGSSVTGLKPWRWWQHAIPGFANATSTDARREQFAAADGTIALYANSPGDFAYVPTRYAKAFADMADWLVDNKVFLEVGFPTLVGHLQANHGAKAKLVEYCTVFDKSRNQYTAWIPSCLGGRLTGNHYYPSQQKPSPPWGIFHPIKLTAFNLSIWDETFDLITKGVP